MTEELLEADPAAERLNDELPADRIGDEAYTARYEQNVALKWTAGLLGLLLAVSVAGNVALALRRPVVRYIRIDAVKGAQAISYNDLDYTPREGEIKRELEDWTKARYSRLRANVAKTYKTNYYFIDKSLASRKMQQDLNSQEIARILAGTAPENDIRMHDITFLSLGRQSVGGAVLASGQAMIDFDKVFVAMNDEPARKEHWLVSVTFYLNPAAVAKESEIHPEYETINPLGVFITDFHETRVLN
jgi:type IV secretion system protein VirB5